MAKKKLDRSFKSSLSEAEMDKFFASGANVLVVGLHGTGKTTSMEDCFRKNKVPYIKYCGATMDPYLELVGVPHIDKDTKGPFMEMIQRKEIRDCQAEAILFDEINRAPKQARNAIMEILQYGTVNGKKFGNIKRIWATANPHDEDGVNYDVEPLNAALEDRFQIRVESASTLNAKYFKDKYGDKIYTAASQWWQQLSDETQKLVSPRRLDQALSLHIDKKLDLKYVIPPACNPSQLSNFLIQGSPLDTMTELTDKVKKVSGKAKIEAEAELASFINDINNFSAVQQNLINYLPDVFHCMKSELRAKYAVYVVGTQKNSKLFIQFLNKMQKENNKVYLPIIKELSKSENDGVKKIATGLIQMAEFQEAMDNGLGN